MFGTLLIRADGGSQTGTGHVMRCLALAQAWRRTEDQVLFAQMESTPALRRRLEAEGCEVACGEAVPGSPADARQTLALAAARQAAWIVGDGYPLGETWQQQIKDAGGRLLVLDDYGHAGRYVADLVLNQNLYATAECYARRETYTRLLLGTRYALLRREFQKYAGWQRQIPPIARKVLVTLGGSDPDNATGKVIEALRHRPDLEATIVVGGSNPNLEQLKSAVAGAAKVRLVVDATDMPELMAWADVAVAAAGSTSWELAFMGLPVVSLVLADNQAPVAAALAREGVGLSLGDYRGCSVEAIAQTLGRLVIEAGEREAMSRRARRLVTGDGAALVVTRLRAALLKLRRAEAQDCRLLWEWANDPQVRASSFSPATIPWEDHVRWFEGKLRSDRCAIFIGAPATGGPVGQVRLDWDQSGQAEIDVSTAGGCRSAGFGAPLIRRAADEAFATLPIQAVHAFIKLDNAPSLRAFAKAGFARQANATRGGLEVAHFTLEKAHE